MDLACGFHVSLSSGSRSRNFRVTGTCDSNSASSTCAIDTVFSFWVEVPGMVVVPVVAPAHRLRRLGESRKCHSERSEESPHSFRAGVPFIASFRDEWDHVPLTCATPPPAFSPVRAYVC